MNLQIKEFARLTGVSVRTLQYYDEIGLLPPACVDAYTGYRYYDEKSLLRMQEILFYRELDFSLKNIGEILSSPHYDKQTALSIAAIKRSNRSFFRVRSFFCSSSAVCLS